MVLCADVFSPDTANTGNHLSERQRRGVDYWFGIKTLAQEQITLIDSCSGAGGFFVRHIHRISHSSSILRDWTQNATTFR